MGALRANGYQAVLACQRRRQLCWTKPYARGGVALVQHAQCVPTRELKSDCGMGAQPNARLDVYMPCLHEFLRERQQPPHVFQHGVEDTKLFCFVGQPSVGQPSTSS